MAHCSGLFHSLYSERERAQVWLTLPVVSQTHLQLRLDSARAESNHQHFLRLQEQIDHHQIIHHHQQHLRRQINKHPIAGQENSGMAGQTGTVGCAVHKQEQIEMQKLCYCTLYCSGSRD